MVGSLVLFIVLSGFSGLKEYSLEYTNIFDSDLKVYPATGKTILFTQAQKKQLEAIPEIFAASRVVEERVFIQFKGKNDMAYIKGVDAQYDLVNPTDSILITASWLAPNKNEVVIGYGISHKLGLGVRDYSGLLELFVPKPGKGQIDVLNPSKDFSKERAVVSGVYFVNEELNSKYIFSDLAFARRLLSMDSTKISALEIKLAPEASEMAAKKKIITVFGEDVDDAVTFATNSGNISSRTKTSASVDWTPDPWTSEGATHDSPDLTTIVQEIINRSGWSSAYNMVFIVTGTGTGKRTAESHNGSSSAAPLLHIEYCSN